MSDGVHTAHQRVNADVRGSSKETRHGTTPEPKNHGTAARRLTGKAVRSRNRSRPSAEWVSFLLCPSSFVIIASLGLNFLICKVEPTMPALNI